MRYVAVTVRIHDHYVNVSVRIRNGQKEGSEGVRLKGERGPPRLLGS